MLDRERTALVVIDVQEAFRKAVDGFEQMASACATLVHGARALELPIIVTEQYPQGLGETAEPVAGALGDVARIEKVVFSGCRAEGFDLRGRRQALVCGIETHVCVHQTVADLLADGVEVHLAVDAVGSRKPRDREVGLARMEHAGAVISSVETALLELVGRAGTSEFKTIQELIK